MPESKSWNFWWSNTSNTRALEGGSVSLRPHQVEAASHTQCKCRLAKRWKCAALEKGVLQSQLRSRLKRVLQSTIFGRHSERSESLASNTPKKWFQCFFSFSCSVKLRHENSILPNVTRCGTSRLLAVNGCQIWFAVFRLRGFHGASIA